MNESKQQSSFNVYQYDAQLASAFQADCEDLFGKFSALNTHSFETFAQIFKETCFTAVFEGQEYILMLHTFLENCFIVVKKFLFSNDPYVQTAAVYLLYALYYKQPIKKWVKIRLTLPESKQLNRIVATHKTNNTLQLVFIHGKMRLDGAFHYCALAQSQGLDLRALKRYDVSKGQISLRLSKECPITKFKALMEEDPTLVQFEDIDNEYGKLVAKYKEKCMKLHVFPANTVGEELKKAYSELFDIDLDDPEPAETQGGVKKRAKHGRRPYRVEAAVAPLPEEPSTSKQPRTRRKKKSWS